MKILPHLRCIPFRVLVVFAGFLTLNFPALASLGGNVNSVETDRTTMSATENVTHAANYDLRQIQSPGGTVVDEYVNSGGTVFAVAWHGQFLPEFQQILGTYFQEYSAALQAQSSQTPKMYGHRPLNIQEQGLVVQTSGHMRAHAGRAYIPSLIPQGMTVNQIQ